MKTIFLIIVMGFSLLSCEKDRNTTEEYPKIYNLNFELLRADGSVYENGEVEISSLPLTIINGNLMGNYDWYKMGIIFTEVTQESDKVLFGGPCEAPNCPSAFIPISFASGAEGVDINGPVPFEKDKYWLLRYANEDIDTLRIHDVQTINPYNRNFTFFVNEQEVEATNFIYEDYAITIQK
jgi:hypothetical protein